MTPRQSQIDRASTVMTFFAAGFAFAALIAVMAHATTAQSSTVLAGGTTFALTVMGWSIAYALHRRSIDPLGCDLSDPDTRNSLLLVLALFVATGGVLFFVVKAPIAVYLLVALSSTCLYHDLSLKYGEGRA